MRARVLGVLAALVGSGLVLGLAGCSEEARESVRETGEEVAGEVTGRVEQGLARTAAEALRVEIREQARGDESYRSVALLETAADAVPGDAAFEGIEDGDGDGLDDDGQIEVGVGDERACVTVSDEEVEVTGGAC